MFTLKNPGGGFMLLVLALKNTGRGFRVDRVRSQKTLVRVFTTLFVLKKPLVGRVLIVFALKNPGRGFIGFDTCPGQTQMSRVDSVSRADYMISM